MTDIIIEEQKLKRCSQCGLIKPRSDFHKHARHQDGLCSMCKVCRQRYRKENHEIITAREKKYREEHPEQIKITKKNSYEKYKEIHREAKNKRMRVYGDVHKAERKEYIRKYIRTAKGKIVVANLRHKRRERIHKTPKEFYPSLAQWENIIQSQHNRCAMCGRVFSNKIKPTIDHIVPLSKGGVHTSANIQALCHSCNSSKHAKIDKEYIQTWIYEGIL